MTKVLKNIMISLCAVFAFLCAGFFFVGCNIDYSKISLTADQQSIDLNVGESVDLTFTIQNYKKGFSNKIQINPRADGQTAVFSVSDPIYLSANEIMVTVTGEAGGHGSLQIVTLEAGKECVVDVFVTQYAKNMEFDNSILYVSNKTDFVPAPNLFNFDENTTYKELSYYYLKSATNVDFSTYYLNDLDLDRNIAIFYDGVGGRVELSMVKFDRVKLVKEEGNSLVVCYGDQNTTVELVSEFMFLSVYDYSVDNEDYEKIVSTVSKVNVLPSIDAVVTGGYMDINTGDVVFEELSSDTIIIVPNNNEKLQYILKVEMNNSIANSPLKINKHQSNNYVDIDFYERIENIDRDKTVYYLKISQNSRTQTTTEMSIDIFYDIAQEIEDESVNISKNFKVEIQIAPTAITINGTTEPEKLTMYNYYKYPEFGWNELAIDVISGYSSSPNFEGIYFEFSRYQDYIDLIYDGVTVLSGSAKLYNDLSKSFYIRGKLGTTQISDLQIDVYVKSDIMEKGKELKLTLRCAIIAGATQIYVDTKYESNKYYYLDYDAGEMAFQSQVYALQKFQFTTYKFMGGVDVIDIDTNDGTPYVQVGERYYLNLNLSPKLTGIGLYRVFLDNGMPIDLTFNVIRTLTEDSTSIALTNEGNESVTEAYYTREGKAGFDNTLNIEILNPSTKNTISFGNSAQVAIVANVTADGIKPPVPADGGYVSIAKMNDYYRIITLDNGTTKITFTLTGLVVQDFGARNEELNLYVNVSSYSLVDEFYLKNGNNYALNNTVYYGEGDLQEEDMSVSLTPVANNTASQNFYQYFFLDEAFVDIFDNAVEGGSANKYIYSLNKNQYYTEIVHEKYNKKFIYYYAQIIYTRNAEGSESYSYSTVSTMTDVVVTKTYTEGGSTKTAKKTISLIFDTGLMFMSGDMQYIQKNETGDVVATYAIEFSNIYSIDVYGTFNLETMTYKNDFPAVYNISLGANLRQRNSTRKYDARITTTLYRSVESISLATNLTQLDFTNDKLRYNIGVYTYPSNSTNKTIRVEFVRTNDNPYSNMISWDINTEESSGGVYTLDLSCEEFYNQNKDNIVNIEKYLTGKIYIYPGEWGDSYTSLKSGLNPICIDVHYRNGSKANPYLIETAEDILSINSNETTLKSHYEISTVIDMSSIQNFVPIGILKENGKNVLHGFSGSIIGTNSQAAITNIVVSKDNFVASIENAERTIDYAGLFAQINSTYTYDAIDELGRNYTVTVTPKIENVTISGKFDFEAQNGAYVGLLSAVNKGDLVNVGTKVSTSTIKGRMQSTLYYGAVAGINYGNIIQDFTKYDGTGYNFKTDGDGAFVLDENENKIKVDENGYELLSSRDFTGQNTKNLAYYNGVLTINAPTTVVYAGGIAGASNGVIERISSQSLKLYGYSAYSAYVQIAVTGTKNFAGYENIFVGGAVGVATYNDGRNNANTILLEKKADESGNRVTNLLVGGEINTMKTTAYADAVGGIVGYTDTLAVQNANVGNSIEITKNTSRVFLRAKNYVGGIVGYDVYSEQYDQYVDFGTENVIETVDDGKNNVYSALIIKAGLLANQQTPEQLTTDDEKLKILKTQFYSIGNATCVGERREYSSYKFDVYSYVKRNFIVTNSEDKVVLNSVSTSDYYGDYIIVTDNIDNTYNVLKQYKFDTKEVKLNLGESPFAMTNDEEPTEEIGVYFMYYFSVSGHVSGQGGTGVQDEIEDLNFITPNSSLYPFSINSNDVNISSSSSSILAVDINGNLTVKGTGLATITLNSILNIVESRVIYIYIVNYFDKDITSSIFYTSANTNGVQITDNSKVNIYGNSNTNVYIVPTYTLQDSKTINGDTFSIAHNGMLNYKNVNYTLSKNTQISMLEPIKVDEGDYFSGVQINKQTIVFFKQSEVEEGEIDNYKLIPMLQIKIQVGAKEYTYYYHLSGAEIDLSVSYKESATSIRTNYKYHSMQTNNVFSDSVTIVSTNEQELLFYEIVKHEDGVETVVQSRLPDTVGQIDETTWEDYVNYKNGYTDGISNRLFDLKFERRDGETNVFDFTCRVDTFSSKYLNRFEDNIFGEYIVRLYASELDNEGAISYSFIIRLDEAEINYISINNYSKMSDVSATDEVLIPSQRGLLEISLDPVEAVFDKIEIANNEINYKEGATESTLTFVYEKISAESGVEYVLAPNFGRYDNGVFDFTYQELMTYIDQLNESFEESGENASVGYVGKFYISYYMPSYNVEDGVDVGFDVTVTYGNEGDVEMISTILLKTKLGSYAKLSFDTKQDFGGEYFVARGLSYGLTLQYYGFSEDQISITSSNNFVADVTGGNGKYTLKVTSDSINYNDDLGYKVEIITLASKTVDNVTVVTRDTLTVYVMEYVMNYAYIEGVNEDIVKGMEDGVIYTAIGNPYKLEFAIREFLEYDATNLVVNKEVEDFVANMTEKISWTVYLNGQETTLQQGKTFRTDYYYIDSYTVTPVRLYNAASDIYHFSASANYSMKNGVYSYSATIINSNPIYTEFSFEVHQQSTENSPIPIETYQEFLNMKDDEWYILLNDIDLAGSEYASINNVTEFKPITEEIAGLDGNGYKLKMSGTYNFTGLTNIGVFSSITEDAILKNVTVYMTSDVVFKTNVNSFEIGVLTSNNAGILTNCLVESAEGTSLSVVCSSTTSSSYVAGMVADNSGYITHSRSKVNIFSNVNLAGFVGQNSGIISSSYYMGASLKNETNTTTEFTAGFAITNTGEIHTSYVSGLPEDREMFYNRSKNTIQSSNNITGFVYTNSGDIEDCYSNIQLKQSGAFASGFVFTNGGSIERCFSTSVLESRQTSNYGFARENNDQGKISECYYLEDEEAVSYRDDANAAENGVNISIGTINYNEATDITALTKRDFAYINTYFANYVTNKGRDINSVWFFNDDITDKSAFNGSTFNIGRLELVAPNIVAYSNRELERVETVVDETTGTSYTRYVYVYTGESQALGSVYNPILISNAEEMEEYILQENNAVGQNKAYYRLVADIDYTEYIYNSKLYTTKFLGYLEGNFMSINAISLISSDSLTSAGLFGELGSSTVFDAVGTIMNLSLTPQAVSFANAGAVGALVGKVDGGIIYNVQVFAPSSSKLVVVGNNIVGGAVGLAVGKYEFVNLYSQLSAKARYQKLSASNVFNSRYTNYAEFSFAGSNVGVLSGNGKVYNTIVDTAVSVLAGKAGIAFGLIDEDATVNKTVVQMQSEMLVNAYSYAGLVCGESKGTVDDVKVNGFEGNFTNFKKIPYIPNAVGGFAGLASGGSLSNIDMTQSIEVSTSSADSGIMHLGGVAGIVTNTLTMSQIKVDGTLIGFTNVGGVTGAIDAVSNVVFFENIDVNATLKVYGHKLSEAGLGGLAGLVEKGSIVRLTTKDTSQADAEVPDLVEKLETLKTQIKDLEQLLQVTETNTDENIALLEQKQAEFAKVSAEIDAFSKNTFNIAVTAQIYVYGTMIDLNVGGVIGTNKSTVPHFIYDTISSVVNTALEETFIYDMSKTYTLFSSTAQVKQEENGDVTFDQGKWVDVTYAEEGEKKAYIIHPNHLSAERTEYYANISFTTVSPIDKAGIYLNLNLFGTPYLR